MSFSEYPNLIIYIDKCATIEELKGKISEKINVSVRRIRLIYGGKSLCRNDFCLNSSFSYGSYNIYLEWGAAPIHFIDPRQYDDK